MTPIQIIATIGPASKDPATIGAMIDAGMSLARLNFSWGTHEEHRQFVADVRREAAVRGRSIPIVQDISGPRVSAKEGHTYAKDASVITDKDREDLKAFSDLGIEYVAQSFVRNAEDVTALRGLLASYGSTSKIIAKIERPEAVAHLKEIIAVTDAVMVARGDLGESLPFETIPFVKKDILAACAASGVPGIVATEMLSSMQDDPDPSRADITDIAVAVTEGASATMLSNETAVGANPVEAVAVMRTVIDEAQAHATVLATARL